MQEEEQYLRLHGEVSRRERTGVLVPRAMTKQLMDLDRELTNELDFFKSSYGFSKPRKEGDIDERK